MLDTSRVCSDCKRSPITSSGYCRVCENERQRAWYAINKKPRKGTIAYIKGSARWALGAAVRKSVLKRLPCEVCGDPKSQGHHDDYLKPLDVDWLCVKHHSERHWMLKDQQDKEEARIDR